ncbi:MAG: hypothetical protein Q7N50_11840 [Armatimonadota bacterium]|nr:hypothetical protein [Armatimonadota bacterium]
MILRMTKTFMFLSMVALVIGVTTEAMALERQLVGVSLGAPMTTVLKKYGNPKMVLIGAASASGTPGVAIGPGSEAQRPSALTGMASSMSEVRSMAKGSVGSPYAGLGVGLGPGALPGLSSVGGMPGAPGGAADPNASASGAEDIRWTYEIPKGPTLEFIVNQGVIAQITASGSKPWPGSKTSKGVGLCDNYMKVLLTYGYPDKQEYVGRYLRVSYLQRSNIVFTLRDSSTVVGITIGLKD